MIVRKSYVFELRPKGDHIRKMRMFAGCARFVFNKALGYHNEQYAEDKKNRFSYHKLAVLLPIWKKELPWLKDCHSQVLQQSLKNLERAFIDFFCHGKGYPRFKKRGGHQSFRFPQGFKVEQHNSRIFLPKIGWVRYRNSQKVEGIIKYITIKQQCGKWFVSITAERDIELPAHPSTSSVGIDMGVVRFATLSDGTFIEPINALKQYQRQLARAQRALARKVKFSKNWYKQKEKIARLHHKIANVRKDYLHKASNSISKNHVMIFMEDLQISNMSKSAKGTLANPGRNVRAKSGLNRSILDQGWGEFGRQLEYKQQWLGGHVYKVPPQNTSRTCPCCGHVSAENRKSQSLFHCTDCGYENHADHVGAINVLRAGHARLACGEDVRPDMDLSVLGSLIEAGTRRSDLSSNT